MSTVKVLVKQKRIISWHAKVVQLETDLKHLDKNLAGMEIEVVRLVIAEALVDLDHLKGKLPPIQVELPF